MKLSRVFNKEASELRHQNKITEEQNDFFASNFEMDFTVVCELKRKCWYSRLGVGVVVLGLWRHVQIKRTTATETIRTVPAATELMIMIAVKYSKNKQVNRIRLCKALVRFKYDYDSYCRIHYPLLIDPSRHHFCKISKKKKLYGFIFLVKL